MSHDVALRLPYTARRYVSMTLLRTLLLALAVILVPQATLAHAGVGNAASASHEMASMHAMPSHEDVRAADVTDCCEATTSQASGCAIDLVAITGMTVSFGARSADRLGPITSSLHAGTVSEALLDPPRL